MMMILCIFFLYLRSRVSRDIIILKKFKIVVPMCKHFNSTLFFSKLEFHRKRLDFILKISFNSHFSENQNTYTTNVYV